MDSRKWGLITSGTSFEELVKTIVSFEDPKAALFGRSGRDGGQDTRSGDGTLVFQAKYHEDGSSAKAISDAKREAEKIAAYRKRDHARYEEWKGVTHWRLVTNATFNPTDRKRWDTEVDPLFEVQGLAADYWERANLNSLLDKHPEVDRAFFRNETRAVLSLPEIRERLLSEEPFLRRTTLSAFFGRDDERNDIHAFLESDELFLVIHGAGGIGKTRLLLEAGEEVASEGSWQVLWANVASMASSATWFEAIVPERPTLLLVDEPEDERILRVLSEQLGGRIGRATKWKVAVAVRSPKDPVLRFLFGPRMKPRVRELAVAALPTAAAEAMCSELLRSGCLADSPDEWREETARKIAHRFSCHPVWLTLAVYLLEKRGDLTDVPETAESLASMYLEEVIRQQQRVSGQQIRALIRWVALVGTVSREDDAAIQLLADRSRLSDGTTVRGVLASLVERRALVQRGARDRLIELKPDVLRDHVLMGWLSVSVGYGDSSIQPSEDARQLVAEVRQALLTGAISAFARSVLTSLARTELILKLSGRSVPLLDPFFSGIQEAVEQSTAVQRLAIADVILEIAVYRPTDTVALCRVLRGSDVADETIPGVFGDREVGHDDIVLELAWPLFHAAMGAQTPTERRDVLEELCAVAEAEAGIALRLPRGLPNDGKRAADLVVRTLQGGPDFWGSFDDVATTLAHDLIQKAAREAPNAARQVALKAVLEPSLSMERRQTWSENYTIHIQTTVVLPGHSGWPTRQSIVTYLKETLADGATPRKTRITLWALLAEAHASANRSRARVPQNAQSTLRQLLLDDLTWARPILDSRGSDTEELVAARGLWDWHYRFEDDAALKAASDQLETIYTSNDLASEFEQILSHDDWKNRRQREAEKANQLAAEDPASIDAFIERAARFLGDDRELHQIYGVAWELGALAPTNEVVREFIRTGLADPEFSHRTYFTTISAASWITTIRGAGDPSAAHRLVIELMNVCGSDVQKLNLGQYVYGRPPRPRDYSELTDAEYDFVRSLAEIFLANGRGPDFIACVGWTIHYDWPTLKEKVEWTLDNVPQEQLSAATGNLFDAVHGPVCEGGPAQVPADIGVWLLDQVIRLPDMDSLGGNIDWHLEEIMRHVGRAPLSWLLGALLQRRELEVGCAHDDRVRALGHQVRLSRYVTQVSAMEAGEPNVVEAVKALMALISDRGTVGYRLHEILHDVDPDGLIVPAEVSRRFAATTEREDAWRLARISGAYSVGSEAWRTIAKPVLQRAVASTTEEQRSLFSALMYRGIRSWSGPPGEVPQIFVSEVESANQRLRSETDPDFRFFWEWCLSVAETELRDREESAKEDRGE